MPLTPNQQHYLQAMGVTVYRDRFAPVEEMQNEPVLQAPEESSVLAPTSAEPAITEQNTPVPRQHQLPDTLQAYTLQLKNQQHALILADWPMVDDAKLTPLRDAICKALGQVQATHTTLDDTQLQTKNILCYGSRAAQFLKNLQVSHAKKTHAFADMLTNPGLKREAWEIMQQLLT